MMVNLMRIFDKPRHNHCGDRRLLHKLKVASLVPLRHSRSSRFSQPANSWPAFIVHLQRLNKPCKVSKVKAPCEYTRLLCEVNSTRGCLC